MTSASPPPRRGLNYHPTYYHLILLQSNPWLVRCIFGFETMQDRLHGHFPRVHELVTRLQLLVARGSTLGFLNLRGSRGFQLFIDASTAVAQE